MDKMDATFTFFSSSPVFLKILPHSFYGYPVSQECKVKIL